MNPSISSSFFSPPVSFQEKLGARTWQTVAVWWCVSLTSSKTSRLPLTLRERVLKEFAGSVAASGGEGWTEDSACCECVIVFFFWTSGEVFVPFPPNVYLLSFWGVKLSVFFMTQFQHPARELSRCAARRYANDRLSRRNAGQGAFATCCVAPCLIDSSSCKKIHIIETCPFRCRLAGSDSYLPPTIRLQKELKHPHRFRRGREIRENTFWLWFSSVSLEPTRLQKQSPEACP